MIKLVFSVLLGFLLPSKAFAHGHAVHPKHNMLLFGMDEIFASHVVYNSPHNFQVILKLTLPADVKGLLLYERTAHPDNKIFLVLDPSDISKIREETQIGGTIARETIEGERTQIASGLVIKKTEFEVLYFDEVSLAHSPLASPLGAGKINVRAIFDDDDISDTFYGCASNQDCPTGQICYGTPVYCGYTNQCRKPYVPW